MCGFAVSLDLTSARRTVEWALPHLRHRGPDGVGHMVDRAEGLGLEHCRLAIIDPENREADQPFSDETDRWTIVYNGELFNYRKLRAGLERRGVRFRTQSDTEVVLASLIADGEVALERFRGMFAFVLWDAKEGSILAARDQIGVKPLYYTVADGMFVAAVSFGLSSLIRRCARSSIRLESSSTSRSDSCRVAALYSTASASCPRAMPSISRGAASPRFASTGTRCR
jgi:asparagine synthase (glutamine-hydrolysing)